MTALSTLAIPTVPFGSTGRNVTRCGLGGEGVLRTHGMDAEAHAVLNAAHDLGVRYFDCARAYAGSEEYQGAYRRASGFPRDQVFQCSKSAERSYAGAMRDLKKTLANLATDYLDLWQIHDVRTPADVAAIEANDGALRAFLEAKDKGLVRHIGVTGHHAPDILTHCVKNWPVDSVLMPINPVEAVLGGFMDKTLPAARERGLAVIGMKILGGMRSMGEGNYVFPDSGVTPELLIRFALSCGIDVAIVGCASPREIATHAGACANPEPLDEETRRELVAAFSPAARQLAYYRGTI